MRILKSILFVLILREAGLSQARTVNPCDVSPAILAANPFVWRVVGVDPAGDPMVDSTDLEEVTDFDPQKLQPWQAIAKSWGLTDDELEELDFAAKQGTFETVSVRPCERYFDMIYRRPPRTRAIGRTIITDWAIRDPKKRDQWTPDPQPKDAFRYTFAEDANGDRLEITFVRGCRNPLYRKLPRVTVTEQIPPQLPPPPPPPLSAVCIPKTTGQVGLFYTASIATVGGIPPFRFSVANGSLPPGLSLDSNTGAIMGTPTSPGEFSFSVVVNGIADQKTLANTGRCGITIYPPPPPPPSALPPQVPPPERITLTQFVSCPTVDIDPYTTRNERWLGTFKPRNLWELGAAIAGSAVSAYAVSEPVGIRGQQAAISAGVALLGKYTLDVANPDKNRVRVKIDGKDAGSFDKGRDGALTGKDGKVVWQKDKARVYLTAGGKEALCGSGSTVNNNNLVLSPVIKRKVGMIEPVKKDWIPPPNTSRP